MRTALAITIPIAVVLAFVITLAIWEARARHARLLAEVETTPAPVEAIPVETTPPVMFGDPWVNDALDWADPVDLLVAPDCQTPDREQVPAHLCYRCQRTNVPAQFMWCDFCRLLVRRTDVMDPTRTAEL